MEEGRLVSLDRIVALEEANNVLVRGVLNPKSEKDTILMHWVLNKQKLEESTVSKSAEFEYAGEGDLDLSREKLQTAWNIAKEYALEGHEVDQKMLMMLAGVIDEKNARNGSRYRTEASLIGGYYPPEAREVPGQINQMLYEISSDNTNYFPVEKAFKAHFDIVRIHPFIDGNGRLARIVQDIILLEANLPPAPITADDRKEYVSRIESARKAYDTEGKDSKPVKDFYRFMMERLEDGVASMGKHEHK